MNGVVRVKVSKKRRCIGCRAMTLSGIDAYCSLGFAIEYVNKELEEFPGQFYTDPVPAGPCPKPMTNKRLVKIAIEKSRGNVIFYK